MFAIYEGRAMLRKIKGEEVGDAYGLFHYLRVVLLVNIRGRGLVQSTQSCISHLRRQTVFAIGEKVSKQIVKFK